MSALQGKLQAHRSATATRFEAPAPQSPYFEAPAPQSPYFEAPHAHQPSMPTTEGCISRPAAAIGAARRISRITARSAVKSVGRNSGTAKVIAVLTTATTAVIAMIRRTVPRAAANACAHTMDE